MDPGRATPTRASPAARRRAGPLAAAAWLTLSSAAAAAAQAPAAAPAPAPCQAGGRYADFDFWVGEWDVLTPDGQQAGTNSIEKAERGCLLVERWTGAGGSTGTSVNFYDPARVRWRQLWVSPSGGLIEIEGGLRDGSMVLEGELIQRDGTRQPFRGTWTPNDDGSVRQHFETSADGSDSWATWFDGNYVRR
jgi:hypothetical protein